MRAMAIVGDFGLDHLKLIERPIPTISGFRAWRRQTTIRPGR
jgi:hypothetical protein